MGPRRADAVVDAAGRRSPVPRWLGEAGIDVPEEIHESGLMYLSRWYRVPDGFDVPLDEKLGGDLGHLEFLAVPGDGRTLSITLAVRVPTPSCGPACPTRTGSSGRCACSRDRAASSPAGR